MNRLHECAGLFHKIAPVRTKYFLYILFVFILRLRCLQNSSSRF